MSKNQFVFTLSATKSIIVNLTTPQEALHSYSEAQVSFVHETEHYILSIDSIIEILTTFHRKITDVVAIKRILHPSITKDIGYLWNQDLQEKPGLVYTTKEDANYWVGLHYLLWSTPGYVRPLLDTWLYNNAQEEIVLEIAPTYPWHFRDPKPHEQYIPYDEWIQNYKPLLIHTLAREQALAWQQQAKEVLEILEKNRSR